MSSLWDRQILLRYLYFHYHQYRSYLLSFQHWRWHLYPPVAVEAIDWNKLMEPGHSARSAQRGGR